jgi:hypothetical protein
LQTIGHFKRCPSGGQINETASFEPERKFKENIRMRIATLLAAASVAIVATATAASAQTSSGSGGVPTNGTSATMGETNPGSTSDKGSTPPVTKTMPNNAAQSGEKQRSLDH